MDLYSPPPADNLYEYGLLLPSIVTVEKEEAPWVARDGADAGKLGLYMDPSALASHFVKCSLASIART